MSKEKVSSYIQGLYEKQQLTQSQYIEGTELQNFGSVVDDDVARMLQVLITIARPKKSLRLARA